MLFISENLGIFKKALSFQPPPPVSKMSLNWLICFLIHFGGIIHCWRDHPLLAETDPPRLALKPRVRPFEGGNLRPNLASGSGPRHCMEGQTTSQPPFESPSVTSNPRFHVLGPPKRTLSKWSPGSKPTLPPSQGCSWWGTALFLLNVITCALCPWAPWCYGWHALWGYIPLLAVLIVPSDGHRGDGPEGPRFSNFFFQCTCHNLLIV